jgi:hypothetical protein
VRGGMAAITETFDTILVPDRRRKIYLILVCISLTLLFYSFWLVRPVIVEPGDVLGLTSRILTPYYITGLALLLFTAIIAFLDREIKSDFLYLVILLSLSLALFAPRVFIEENAPFDWAWFTIAPVKNVLMTEHFLDIAHPPFLLLYYSWPAFQFISFDLTEITGVDLGALLKYGPLLFTFGFPLVIYGVGKRFHLEPRLCFTATFLAVASWFVIFQGYYHPRSFAMFLFLVLLILLIAPKKTAAETLTVILVYAGLLLTHGLNSFAVIPGLILLALFRRDYSFVALFIVLFGAWYMYEATPVMTAGMEVFLRPFRDILLLAQVERYQEPASIARLVTRYSDLIYLGSYVLLMAGAFFLLLRKKIAGENRRNVIALFCWSIGVASINVLGWTAETPYRAYSYALVSATFIVALCFSKRWLLVPLMCLFVLLSPLANYSSTGGSANAGQILTSEYKGTEFFADNIKTKESYFYGYSLGVLLYHNQQLMYVHHLEPTYVKDVNISDLDSARYVILSTQSTEYNSPHYPGGVFPYDAWPQTAAGQNADLIYNNGYFQIYENLLIE